MLFLIGLASASDDETPLWVGGNGVDGLDWGTANVPLDAVPRPKDINLPDSSYIGRNKQDRPDDMEVGGPPGERRFLRYASGVLVDAWLVSERPLDPARLISYDRPDWTGVILGPADDGFLAYGTASNWTVGGRTLLHWRDRAGALDILVSRAAPTPQYGIGRPRPLEKPGDSGVRVKLSGELKKAAKPFAGSLAGCFDTSPKPVEATIVMKMDGGGVPSRIRVSADQPAFNLEDCVAASLMDVRAAPNFQGTLKMLRFR